MQVKRRTFSGVVCEQEIYTVPDSTKNIKTVAPRLRFKNEEEREQHRLGMSRRYHARLVNENFGPSSLYTTLTMDDENEVHTFAEARKIRDNYIRRLRYHCPEARIMIYMGRGKNTHRIHMHMLSDGVPEDELTRQWKYGTVLRTEKLREHNYYNKKDYGRDYTGLADYLFDHWTKEQGGHRWKQTRNLKKPEVETPKPVKRTYSEHKPPKAPEGYKLVEVKTTPFGYMYFKYIYEVKTQRLMM